MDENKAFAPFDLSKTQKFNKVTQRKEMSENFYKLAVIYYDVALHTLVNMNWMPVTLSNAAFSCELFLKALLYGFGIDFEKTHGLKDLFEKLPQNEQAYIAENIAIENRDKEFFLCLNEQNNAFMEYRYMCEAKAITGNPIFLLKFAHILKFVYQSLVKENSKSEESSDTADQGGRQRYW